MEDAQDPAGIPLNQAEALRLAQLKETLAAAHIQYAIFAQDTLIRSAQDGVGQGLGELANDERVLEVETIFGGCGVPRYTLKINPRDLMAVTQARVFDFTEFKEKTGDRL